MAFSDFRQFSHTYKHITHPVYHKGTGPPVLVMHELPGMVPECIAFAERLVAAGFSVYLPLLFGRPNKQATAANLLRLCISREFYLFAKHKTSPIVAWLRDLCSHLHTLHGPENKGVGAIGMCLTGGFAIPLLVEPSLMAPVLSQPSLPANLSAAHKRALGYSQEELQAAKARVEAENLRIKAFRFSADKLAPKARIQTLQQYFGPALEYHELPSDQQAPHGKGCHAVFTIDFVDEPAHPTSLALEELIAFFRQRLM